MASCNGNCAACGGCARELVLGPRELEILFALGQIPFMSVGRQADREMPVDPEEPTEEKSLLLQLLEKKGLISLDYDLPIKGADYGGLALRGSYALTARGQQVLDLAQYQGLA